MNPRGKDSPAEEVIACRGEAMATAFCIRIAGLPEKAARQAGAAALAEIGRLEPMLSRYIEGSDIDRINRADAGERVRVSADVLDCLSIALEVARMTGGAFDPSLGELTGDPLAGASAPRHRSRPVGHRGISIDLGTLSVSKADGASRLDLGGVGKGFALDCASSLLQDWGVPAVMLDAGGSTVLAFDSRSERGCWTAGLECPDGRREIPLQGRALAGSGTGVRGLHIIDARTRAPVRRSGRVWAMAHTAAEADALSTAGFVMRWTEILELCAKIPELGFAGTGWDHPDSPVLLSAGVLSALLR